MFPAPLLVSPRPGGPGSRDNAPYVLGLPGTGAQLVRGLRARSAVAGARRLAVGGAGQRDHAAADAREPGPARLPGLARAVADARGARRRSGGRGRAAVGAARLPPPGAAPGR